MQIQQNKSKDLKMKKIFIIIISAIIGSILTIGIYYSVGSPLTNKPVDIEHIARMPVKGAVYTTNEEGDVVPLDFTKASKEVMDAVVHIMSTQTIKQTGSGQYQPLPDPFRDFFGDDFFKYFFGPMQQSIPVIAVVLW